MKSRAILLAAAAAVVVVTVLAMGERPTVSKPADAVPAKAEPARPRPPASDSQAPTWAMAPRPSETPPPYEPPSPGAAAAATGGIPPHLMFAPTSLADRVAALARQVDSGSGGEPYELYSLLNECAVTPQRLALSTGCVSGGDCGPPQQRLERYQQTLAACQQVPADMVARRQQYLDLAAARGDPRAQQARQQLGR